MLARERCRQPLSFWLMTLNVSAMRLIWTVGTASPSLIIPIKRVPTRVPNAVNISTPKASLTPICCTTILTLWIWRFTIISASKFGRQRLVCCCSNWKMAGRQLKCPFKLRNSINGSNTARILATELLFLWKKSLCSSMRGLMACRVTPITWTIFAWPKSHPSKTLNPPNSLGRQRGRTEHLR